jgi:hypothetical protein
VQEFGLPAVQPVALTDKPTQVQTTSVPAPSQAQVSTAPEVKTAAVPTAQPVNNIRSDASAGVAMPQPVIIQDSNVQLVGDNVQINAQVSGPAVKVLAYFGQQAVMLEPKENNTWTAEAPASQLAQTDSTVKVQAFDIKGQSVQMQLADFSTNTQANYNLAGTTPTSNVTFMGQTFDPKSAESKFYMFIIAGLLSSLILAIAIKKHIQHLPLIANTSFAVIFACLLFMT